MSDGVNITGLPLWEHMNFSKSCDAWGECVPDGWQKPDDWTEGMYHGYVLDWYGFNYNSYPNGTLNFTDKFLYNLILDPSEVCKTQQVFTSYFVEAIIITILLLTYSFWRFRLPYPSCKNPEPNGRPSGVLHRFVVGLQESLQNFLDASEFFSIAMLVAALYLSSTGLRERKEPGSNNQVPQKTALYDMLLSMLASTFSVFPVIIAYSIKRRHPPDSEKYNLRPALLSMAILSLIWILSVVEAFISLYGNLDYDYGEADAVYAKEYNCDWRASINYWVGMRAAQALLLFCPLFFVIMTGFLITGFGISGVVHKPLVARCRRLWRLVIAWVNLLAMWGVLGFFTWVRHKIDLTVGHLNESNE
ncbi:hypothetical protein KVR01_005935 [Diaporthe batatas]|uniref:uncharacterized protein n=1 Tax=Diaporthe batatas TaxID=748121 RepID=UPI001D0405BF|nr:uncharacterized protein KVR01_005935 [Diaporthe batatas]KAG8164017.1 hypothetical protein KVR01_005935 [Diaporthe batatas]